jgi:hypothetical protein
LPIVDGRRAIISRHRAFELAHPIIHEREQVDTGARSSRRNGRMSGGYLGSERRHWHTAKWRIEPPNTEFSAALVDMSPKK